MQGKLRSRHNSLVPRGTNLVAFVHNHGVLLVTYHHLEHQIESVRVVTFKLAVFQGYQVGHPQQS